MSKTEEVITSKMDILHTNYKSKNASFKKFIEFFDKISKLYQGFSDSIELIFSKNISITENQPISLQPLLSSLESFIKGQATEFHKVSKRINKEIIESYKLLKESNDKLELTTYKDLNEYNKTLKKSKNKLEESHNIYLSKMKNLETSMTTSEYKQIKSNNNETKDKKKLINDLITECKNDEIKYEKYINDVNSNLEKVREKENVMIGFYKGYEQNRINKMKDDVNILLNTLKNLCLKLNTNIERIFKDTAKLEIEKDILSFEKLVEKNYKVEKNVEFIAYKPITKLNDFFKITEKKSEFDEMLKSYKLISTLKNNFKNICPEIDIAESKNSLDFRILCQRLLDNDKNISFSKEDLDNLLSSIKREKYRSFFLSYLTKERSDGKLIRSEKIINELSIIFHEILILAEKEGNFRNAKNVIILSQTFYMENDLDDNDENNKKYLMDFLKDNNWIHSINFWEDIIEFEIIGDRMKFSEENLSMEKAKLEATLQNIYYSKLLTYSHNMCIFGIEQKLTLQLCNSIIDKYQIDENYKIIIQKSIEDMYNPKKKEIKNENDINKITKCKKLNKSTIQIQKNKIDDDWVICTDENKINNNNFVDDFVIEDNKININENFNVNKKDKKSKKNKK